MSDVTLENLSAQDRAKLLDQARQETQTNIFKCPGVLHPDGTRTECDFRSFTLAASCPEHNVMVG